MAQMSSLATAGSGPCKLYVKNLHPNITVSPADHATLPLCSQHVFVGSITDLPAFSLLLLTAENHMFSPC